jgi:hypothetical protein
MAGSFDLCSRISSASIARTSTSVALPDFHRIVLRAV